MHTPLPDESTSAPETAPTLAPAETVWVEAAPAELAASADPAAATAAAPHAQDAQDVQDAQDTQSGQAFAALGLAPELLRAVAELGFTEPTPVQQQAIPLALSAPAGASGVGGAGGAQGFIDLMVSSQTGSGKTAAFLLPVLHTLIGMQAEQAAREKAEWDARVADALARGEAPPRKPRRKNPTDRRHFKAAQPGALVLCPTRELAQQVAADAIDLVRHVRGVRIATVVGGMPYQMQIARLQNANLVVATPGRLLDLAGSGQIRLDGVRFLVLDEADRMLDLGFADELAEIHLQTQQRQQTMMFSATFAPRIQQLAMRVMHDGGAKVQRVQVATPQERHANIRQELYWADSPEHKRALLDHWLRDAAIDQAIVFACTQIECEQLAEDLQQAGFAAVALHGALSQSLRNRRLAALRDGRVQILVATDVAARGIDVPTITHVFNYGLPMKAEDYTHRIGRTGRAGRDGLAVTLAEIRDRRRLADIEAYTRQHFRPHTVAGLEPQKYFPPVTDPRGMRGKGGVGPKGKGSKGGKGGRSGPPPRRADSRGPRQMGAKAAFRDDWGSRPVSGPDRRENHWGRDVRELREPRDTRGPQGWGEGAGRATHGHHGGAPVHRDAPWPKPRFGAAMPQPRPGGAGAGRRFGDEGARLGKPAFQARAGDDAPGGRAPRYTQPRDGRGPRADGWAPQGRFDAPAGGTRFNAARPAGYRPAKGEPRFAAPKPYTPRKSARD